MMATESPDLLFLFGETFSSSPAVSRPNMPSSLSWQAVCTVGWEEGEVPAVAAAAAAKDGDLQLFLRFSIHGAKGDDLQDDTLVGGGGGGRLCLRDMRDGPWLPEE